MYGCVYFVCLVNPGYHCNFVYVKIRHRAFRHEKRVRATPSASKLSNCPLSAVRSLVLRTPQLQDRVLPDYPRGCFRTISQFFPEAHLFTTICTKKAPKGPHKTPQKLKNLQKTWPLNAPAAELCKKAPSGRGEALKAWQALCFRDIQGKQGPPKNCQNDV